jgi:hypothetical protein
MDPAKQQYLILSAIISFIISFILNFPLNDFIQAANAFGFPFSTANSSGIASLFIQLINTVVMGGFLIVPMYMFFDYVNNRR